MTDGQTLTYLAAERNRHPELGESLDLHIAILQARSRVEFHPAHIPEQEAQRRLGLGEPMLRAEELAIDWIAFAQLCKRICDIAARANPADAEVCEAFSALPDTREAAAQLVRDHLQEQDFESLPSFVLNNAIHPFLSAYARAAHALVIDVDWYHSYCPVCGGTPDLGALCKESGARRLLCSRCDFEWSFYRSTCPFCGEERDQGYFSGGRGAYRLCTCERCGRYLKTIDLRDLARDVNLPGERILTLGMDIAARAAGYL